MLQKSHVKNVPIRDIVEQIIGRRKAREKLSTFYDSNNIVYPPGINLEQTSSEQTAKFKISEPLHLISEKHSCADLTGGFGVDTFFLSKVFKQVYTVEPNESLIKIAEHNHRQLGATEMRYFNTTAQEFLQSSAQNFDCIYVDPSRRDRLNKKMFSFSDCEPDLTSLLQPIFSKTDFLLVKASPLLDIKQGQKELTCVRQIFVVSVNNECKELLFLCQKNYTDEPLITAVNLSRDGRIDALAFRQSEEAITEAIFSEPLTYLYEPNASILKAGAFKLISDRFGIKKLHPNTHLYTSDKIISDFPGRTFRVVANVKAVPKALKVYFKDGQANVSVRNYPLTVEELRRKTGLKDGGEKFLLGFSGENKKFLVVAEKVS